MKTDHRCEMSSYQKTIAVILAKQGRVDIDPRHVEGYMRLQYSTLDHLSLKEFEEECRICTDCVDVGGIADAEQNALSYAL